MLTELRLRETAGAGTFELETVGEDPAHRVEQPLPLAGVERRQRRVGRQLRPPQRVVRVAPSDAGDGPLVAQDRVDAAAVVTVEDQLRELVGVGLRAEALERAVVAGREHPPRGLALGTELPHEDRGPALAVGGDEPEAHDPALAAGLLGRILDVDPPGLRQVHEDAPDVAELEREVLAVPADALERGADQRVGRREGPS